MSMFGKPEECKICGKEFKNLGVHMYQMHKSVSISKNLEFEDGNKISSTDTTFTSEIKVDDVIKEKLLSVLISEIKNLLKPYQNELIIRISEKGGKMKEIEITARIQL